MIEATTVFGGEFDKKKYLDLVACLNSVQKIQNLFCDLEASHEEIVERFTEKIGSFASSRHASLLFFNGNELVTVSSTRKEANGEKRRIDDDSPYAKVFNGGNPLLLKNKVPDAEYAAVLQKMPGFSRSTMLVPLLASNEKPFGVLAFYDKKINDKLDFFEQHDLNLISIVSGLVSPTLFWYFQEREAQRSATMKDDMVHAVIHDLKSPVFCLKKVLEEQKELPEQVHHDLDLLYNRVINSLDIARVQENKLILHKEFIYAAEILGNVAESLQKYAEHFKVTLSIGEIDKNEGFDGDPDLMVRVFENLLTNAIKHSSPENGGTGNVTVKPVSGIAEMTISIADTGTGVPDDFKSIIFEKFVQVKSIRGSSGLGLTFCKLVVEAHRGKITVENNSPQGAIFNVTLPFASEEEESTEPKEVKRKTILAPPSL